MIHRLIIVLILSISTASFSATETSNITKEAQEQFQATFQNMTVSNFQPSPIDGLFEMSIEGRIIYFHPEAEALFLGEILSKDGTNLTAASTDALSSQLVDNIPLELAVVIGPEDGVPIIEFSDPHCPYCVRYHNFMGSIDKPVRRYVFFETRIHPEARDKVVHILCANDQEAAYNEVYSNTPPNELISCEAGEQLASKHLEISRDAGVNATPSFFLDRNFKRGFRREDLVQYIEQYKHKS